MLGFWTFVIVTCVGQILLPGHGSSPAAHVMELAKRKTVSWCSAIIVMQCTASAVSFPTALIRSLFSNTSFHSTTSSLSGLKPKLKKVPKGVWHCPSCAPKVKKNLSVSILSAQSEQVARKRAEIGDAPKKQVVSSQSKFASPVNDILISHKH
jgi:hypothetical protein